MSESGQTWQRGFKAAPIEAAGVRAWTRTRTPHPDAPQIAHELFVALLKSGADVVEVAISTAGARTRITASGPAPLPLRHSHGPGWRLIAGLSLSTGMTPDECGLWAELAEPDR